MKQENLDAEGIYARDKAAQVFCWCIVIAMHQEEGIGAQRLEKACGEMKIFEESYKNKIIQSGRKTATEAMREMLDGICDFDIVLPSLRYPKNRREERIRAAENTGARIAWLVMASTARKNFLFGKDRLERLKNESLANYRQYIEWKADAGEDYALEQIRRCVSAALREELSVADCSTDQPPTFSTVGGISSSDMAAIVSTISSNIARRNGVSRVPLLVMSESAAEEKLSALDAGAMKWKDIR